MNNTRNNNFRSILLSLVCIIFSVPAWSQVGVVQHEDIKISASDGDNFDNFGWSVDIDNGIIAVGAYMAGDNGPESGAAYLFDASNGNQIAELLPNDGAAGDRFGMSIAIDNGIVAVGAYLDDDKGVDSGSVYLFNVSTGLQIAKIVPDDGAKNNWFGYSLAINLGNLAVGAVHDNDLGFKSGSAYVFDMSTGIQLVKLLPSDGEKKGNFGQSVAINNDLVAVGTLQDNGNGIDSGSVYLFDLSTGTQLYKLLPVNGQSFDHFGTTVAIYDDVVVVGASGEDNDNGQSSGSVYLFSASTGSLISILHPIDGAAHEAFGSSIDVDNGIIAIGEVLDHDNGTDSGSAFLFDINTGLQIAKFLPSDGAEFDNFGNAIAIDNGTVVVGARKDDNHGRDAGSAYIFQPSNPANILIITPNPLLAGQDGTFSITNTLPDEQTWLLYSTDGIEQTFIRELNVIIDLANPLIAVQPRKTDNNGDLQFIIPMPGTHNPLNLWFQAVQHRNVTNFVTTQLIP